MSIPRISEAEWVVMKVVWRRNPVTANEVVEELSGSTEWNPRTIRTLINRLTDKGALSRDKSGGIYSYRPAVDEDACLEAESESFLERFFGGSLNPMVAHFIDKGRLTVEEFEELKKRFSKKEE
jgi:BlaI family penicillinase repressor